MLIFNGWGGFAGLLGAGLIGTALIALTHVPQLAWAVAGLSLFAFGFWLNSTDEQRHGLFWIPIQYWGLLIVFGGFFSSLPS